MSPFLQFDCSRVDEPAAADGVEAATWARLRMLVERRCVTQFWNRQAQAEGEDIYVPTFALAQWFVENWWSIFYEPCRWETPPQEGLPWTLAQQLWVQRHSLRAAESGLFLPNLRIYSDGPGVALSWSKDEPDGATGMPGYFLYGGFAHLEVEETMDRVGEFIGKVLTWCQRCEPDDRVGHLAANWGDITGADAEEKMFCRAAGRLGLDPYFVEDWPVGLAELLARTLGDRLDQSLIKDLLESASAEEFVDSWYWFHSAQSTYGLDRASSKFDYSQPRLPRAKDEGYALARELRRRCRLGEVEPVEDLPEFVATIVGQPLVSQSVMASPTKRIGAAVGWRDGHVPTLIGALSPRPDARRFLEARGIYQVLTGCAESGRLVTSAMTRSQQASRAFAAELLAPQQALAREATPEMDAEERQEVQLRLAKKYDVAPFVIRHQLENYGIWRQFGWPS